MNKKTIFICCLIIILLAPSALAVDYYMSPTGNDGNSGLSTTEAWATLQHAAPLLQAGDTLYVMGGVYSDNQYILYPASFHGAPGNPITIKAYGDSVAVFQHAEPTDYRNGFVHLLGINDYITIDGYGLLGNEPYQLRFEGQDSIYRYICLEGSAGNFIENITISGVEFNASNVPGAERVNNPIDGWYLRYLTIEDSIISYANNPPCTGIDCTSNVLGDGDCIYFHTIEFSRIENNIFSYCNHAAMMIKGDMQRSSNYNKILNNKVDSRWGGGIYFVGNTSNYNLFEGNIITHAGDVTTYTKAGLYVNGNYNTIRKNVLYNPSGEGLSAKVGYSDSYGGAHIVNDFNHNLVYNNVVFGSGGENGNSGFSLNLDYIAGAYTSTSFLGNNLFANNIFYNSVGQCCWGRTDEMEIFLLTLYATANNNWLEPDPDVDPDVTPASTNWGDNNFTNNLIRRDSDGMSDSDVVMWVRDRDYGEIWVPYSVNGLENDGSYSWRNNVGDDPLLVSENPDGYGLTNGWWYLQEGSPCVDAGVVVDDWIGAQVNNDYPGWGWDNLPYNGVAPDIGAWESPYTTGGGICEANDQCFYISPTGSDITGNGSFEYPWATFGRADSYLGAGDILYLRGGEYTSLTDIFVSANSGTSVNPIMVKAYPGETPVIRSLGGSSSTNGYVMGIFHDWWIIDGLEFRPLDTTMRMEEAILLSGNNNIIRNVVVEGTVVSSGDYTYWENIRVTGDYNEIYNCSLFKGGDLVSGYPTGSGGRVLRLVGDYNRVHDCDLQRGVHDIVGIDGVYNELYDNVITHAIGYGFNVIGNHNLVERNSITGCDEDLDFVKNPIYILGDYNIIRYNTGWNNEIYGVDQECGTYGASVYNRVYNNVFYNNGRNGLHAFNPNGGCENNLFVNNVFARNMRDETLWNSYYGEIAALYGYELESLNNEFRGNYIVAHVGGSWQDDYTSIYIGTSGSHRSVSYMESNYNTWSDNIYNYCDMSFTDSDNGDFTLQENSCLIDAGLHLTSAVGSGTNSVNLVVDDAYFFWEGDEIKIGDDVRTISSIDYSTHTITLNLAATWNNGDYVDLTFQGNAPDIGAWESPWTRQITGECDDGVCNQGETCNACPQDCIIGDVDGNCNVGLTDLIIVAGNFGCTGDCGDSDIDDNNVVNILDLILVGKNFT